MHIPRRHEIPESDTWDLSLLYADEAAYRRDLATLVDRYPGVANFRGTLAQSAHQLLRCLELEKELDLLKEKLGHYTSLKAAEDASDHSNLARRAELQNLFTRIAEATSFVAPEIQAIPDDVFEQFVTDPILHEWVTPLRKLRRYRPHTLNASEERIIALGATALRGHRETFSQLTNVDMRFGTVEDENGTQIELSQSSYYSMMTKRNRSVRQRAFVQFYREFDEHKYTLASALAASVRGDVFYARIRNYPSALEAALFRDDIPIGVYENLISTGRANLGLLHDYYELRRTVLGLDEIHAYDNAVPLVAEVETDIPFEQAAEMVTGALQPLGEEYVATVRTGLRSRWVDRYETKGKRSGAFSSSSYGNPPFILMNYRSDVLSDVFTLAHETGHSMHSWYSQRDQLFQNYGYPIFLAEVASTFNEALLTHYLLEKAETSAMRAYLLDRQIESIRSVLFRQTMLAEFERDIHALEEQGGPITLEAFQRSYGALLKDYFGPRFTLDPALEIECLRIPHFYSAFYVYKYATGLSAALTLAQQVLAGADVHPYLRFLSSGGSKFPLETLLDAGVDMRSPQPIEQALSLFGKRVTELRGLLGNGILE